MPKGQENQSFFLFDSALHYSCMLTLQCMSLKVFYCLLLKFKDLENYKNFLGRIFSYLMTSKCPVNLVHFTVKLNFILFM